MPKKIGNIVFTGNDGGLCAYFSRGRWICRASTSLTGARVKKDPAFAGFRESGNRMKRASPVAASLYNLLPKEKKEYSLYRILTGEVIKMIKEEIPVAVIRGKLKQRYIDPVLNGPVKPLLPVTEAILPGRSAFSGVRLFTAYPPCTIRNLRRRRVMQPAGGSLPEEVPQMVNVPLQQPVSSPLPLKKAHSATGPQGALYLGRPEGFGKLKMWLLPADHFINIEKTYRNKNSRHVSLFQAFNY